MKNDHIKNDLIKSDHMKNDCIKSDCIKTDRIKSITDPLKQLTNCWLDSSLLELRLSPFLKN
jgi:hypothetical protein